MAEPQGPRRDGPAHAGPLPLEEVAERAARLGITVERVLDAYRRIAFATLGDIVEWDETGMKLKSDADTLVLAFGRAIRLPKTIEHERQVLFGNSHAGIGNAQDELVAGFFRAKLHTSTGWSELERIKHQVQNDLFELVEARRKLGVFDVRPGITGLAQVRGVDMSNPDRLAELDAQYVKSQSFVGDLGLIWATLRGQGVGVDQIVKT